MGGRADRDCARTGCGPAGWTSADAAGLPILPGLARYEDVARGRIDHALRFTVQETRRAYVWPARHFAARIVLQALEGVRDDRLRQRLELVSQRSPHPKWSNDQLRTLRRVPGSASEVVDGTKLKP